MGCTASTAPQCLYKGALTPPWAVRSVQGCTYSPMGCTACTEPQCLYKCALTPRWAVRPVKSLSACTSVHLLPQGLYGLYRASVPVQVCTYSPMVCTACTEPQCLYKCALTPPKALRPVKSLSACTSVHLLPQGLYGLYRASVPVQGCTLPLTLLPLTLLPCLRDARKLV